LITAAASNDVVCILRLRACLKENMSKKRNHRNDSMENTYDEFATPKKRRKEEVSTEVAVCEGRLLKVSDMMLTLAQQENWMVVPFPEDGAGEATYYFRLHLKSVDGFVLAKFEPQFVDFNE